MEQQDQIFSLYKPLRNSLRAIDIDDALYVLWAYFLHLEFSSNLPSDIKCPMEIKTADKFNKKFYPWELYYLWHEVIINSTSQLSTKKTLKKWDSFSNSINLIKDLENNIAKICFSEETILKEFFRISHREFPWQEDVNQEYLMRYYKIFQSKGLSQMIENVYGMSMHDLFITGFALCGMLLSQSKYKNGPITSQLPEIKQEMIDKVLNQYSKTIDELKNITASERKMNENLIYSYSVLMGFPLVRHPGNPTTYTCPSISLLFKRFTSGLYFDLFHQKNFDETFGQAFQNYIGEILAEQTKINYFPEELYGKCNERTSDWILIQNDAIVFVECKTKRVQLKAKAILDSDEYHRDLDIMADALLQTYKNINDFQKNIHPANKKGKFKTVFPLIITLEDWYLCGPKLLSEINERLTEKMKIKNIDTSYIQKFPYSICSAGEFEKVILISNSVEIEDLFKKKTSQPFNQWTLGTFLNSEYPELFKNKSILLKKEFEDVFSKFIKYRK